MWSSEGCGELLHLVYSPAVFPILKRRDKTSRTSRGKTLSIESMELAVSESELYLDITAAFILKVREGKAGAQPALLERDREIKSSS
jgi:hypothetical protein